jgi:4-methyl-5(b-hydroxyethyl)-thiazole monophosphate biosynthesis
MRRLVLMRIGVFFGERFEEIEGLTVVDILRRQGYDVETISVGHSHHVGGSHGIVFKADFVVDEVWFKTFDMLVLPGGPGHTNLEKCDLLMKYVKKFGEEGKFVAAICASPSILGRAGLLKGKKATCFPGYEAECKGAECTGAEVEWDGNIITGRSAGCAVPFALKIIEAIDGKAKAQAMAEKIGYDHYE